MKKEIRSLKVASVLHRAISRVLREGKVFNKNIVISYVKLSKDLSKADIYIVLSSFNKPVIKVADTEVTSDLPEDDFDINSVVNEMNKSAWLIRKSILNYVELRFIPELIFKPDLGFNNFINVNEILHNYTN